MKVALFIGAILITAVAYPQSGDSTVRFNNPPAVSSPKGYAHAAEIDLGTCTMVLISGQVALDKEGRLVRKNDFARQTETVFQNIKHIVEASGGTMDHIVKIGIFTTDMKRIQDIRQVRDRYLNTANPPASTLVAVSSLFRDDLFIEIEATAIIPRPLSKK